jgi:serine/threonine protein kinase
MFFFSNQIEESFSFDLVDKSSRSKFYFVFEFCDHDLAGILRNANVKFSLGHIKSIMQQLLDGRFHLEKCFFISDIF